MSVTKDQVIKTAKLAHLDLTEGLSVSEADSFITKIAQQMDEIVGYMDILNQVDTSGVEPFYSPMMNTAPPREDIAKHKRTAEEILSNAPERHDCYFVVPPVL